MSETARLSDQTDMPIPRAAHAKFDVVPQWFAVYTTSRHEKTIAEHFALREIESFLPLYRAQRLWKNGCRIARASQYT